MDQVQVGSVTRKIKGLFPALTDHQVELLERSFVEFPLDVVESVIDYYATKNERLSIPDLLARLRDKIPSPKPAALTSLREREEVIRERLTIDTALGCVNEEVLSRLKEAVIEKLPPDARGIYHRRDTRTSPTLRPLIYREYIAKQNSVAHGQPSAQ